MGCKWNAKSGPSRNQCYADPQRALLIRGAEPNGKYRVKRNELFLLDHLDLISKVNISLNLSCMMDNTCDAVASLAILDFLSVVAA